MAVGTLGTVGTVGTHGALGLATLSLDVAALPHVVDVLLHRGENRMEPSWPALALALQLDQRRVQAARRLPLNMHGQNAHTRSHARTHGTLGTHANQHLTLIVSGPGWLQTLQAGGTRAAQRCGTDCRRPSPGGGQARICLSSVI